MVSNNSVTQGTYLTESVRKANTRPRSRPLAVGCCDIMVGKSKKGTLMRAFYPTSAKLSAEPSYETWTPWYLGPEHGNGIARYVAPSYLQGLVTWMFNKQTSNILVPSVWCGDLLNSSVKFPVIVFSHGLSSNRSFYSSVCCQLASHGYFVAALEHRDGSSCSSFTLSDSGEKEFVLHERLSAGIKEFELRNSQIKLRIEESCRTLDTLEQLDKGGLQNELKSSFDLSQLVDKLDFSRTIMAGHSFGGCTTIGALAKDKRFKLGIALDPWLFPLKNEVDEVCPKVDQPILCVSTEKFQTESNLTAMSKLPNENSTFVTIKGTVHQNQTDSPFVLGGLGRYLGGAQSPLDHLTAMNINNALMLNFIDTHHGVPHAAADSSKYLSLFSHLVDCGEKIGTPFKKKANL